MGSKMTYARPVVWEPSATDTSKLVSSSGREVASLKLVASGGAATAFIYDTNVEVSDPNKLKWVLDSSQAYTDSDNFTYGLGFKEGIYVDIVSGAGFNPKFCMAVLHDQV